MGFSFRFWFVGFGFYGRSWLCSVVEIHIRRPVIDFCHRLLDGQQLSQPDLGSFRSSFGGVERGVAAALVAVAPPRRFGAPGRPGPGPAEHRPYRW
jgi:hypothetical protein